MINNWIQGAYREVASWYKGGEYAAHPNPPIYGIGLENFIDSGEEPGISHSTKMTHLPQGIMEITVNDLIKLSFQSEATILNRYKKSLGSTKIVHLRVGDLLKRGTLGSDAEEFLSTVYKVRARHNLIYSVRLDYPSEATLKPAKDVPWTQIIKRNDPRLFSDPTWVGSDLYFNVHHLGHQNQFKAQIVDTSHEGKKSFNIYLEVNPSDISEGIRSNKTIKLNLENYAEKGASFKIFFVGFQNQRLLVGEAAFE